METQPTNAPAMPGLNKPAPDFDAPTTHGPREARRLRGKWLVLFSHPADFTPVCTTEFMAFAKRHDDFKALNCELLGLSIDSTFSHIAWMQSIEENFGVRIDFPIIDDLSMQVATAYGMIQPGASDTSAVARHVHHRPRRHPARHGLLSDDQRPFDRRVSPPRRSAADQRRQRRRQRRRTGNEASW